MDFKNVANEQPVKKLNNVFSLLGQHRLGHARFRRAPPSIKDNSQVIEQQQSAGGFHEPPVQEMTPPPPPPAAASLDYQEKTKVVEISSAMGTGKAGDEKCLPVTSFQLAKLSKALPAEKPPEAVTNLSSGKCESGSSSQCHCSKKRKLRSKRVVRVPAISSKIAEIPPDDYSWRKYGQKPIKGSPHPRGYYKCSTVKGCPARKHVDRAVDDPAMLIVTYEGEHSHPISVAQTTVVLESS